jgi:hypothetical protein
MTKLFERRALRVAKQKANNQNASQNDLITPEEVYDVLKFAQAAYGGQFNGYFTPDLINARMKDISLSPQAATASQISAALLNPKENEQQLVGYSEYMELVSMLYKRILLYFSGLLSFDINYVALNVKDESEYKSTKYKNDLGIVADFFDKFNIKQEFRVVLKQMLRQEAYFGILRDDGERYTIQELPQQFCKLTGRWSNGLLFDFNMIWFWNGGVDINMYPAPFKRMYRDVYNVIKEKRYDPAIDIQFRTGGWVYWKQTSPKDGFVAFKLFPEIATVIPFLSPMMADAALQPVIRELQKNAYIAEASKLIVGQVEFIKDAVSKVKDSLSISPETLGKFLALMKAGIPDAIKVAAAPLANITGIEFDGNNEMYDSYLKSAASVSGVNSRLLYSFDRQNVLETQLSLDIDQNVLRPVYHQLENMLDYWVNQRTKKYKFKFMLEGFNTKIDRDARLKDAMTLAESGIVLEQKIASAIGMSPFDFRRMLAEGRENKFVEKLTPILKAAQMPKEAIDSSGRPKAADGDLSDSGAETREAGANEEKTQGG